MCLLISVSSAGWLAQVLQRVADDCTDEANLQMEVMEEQVCIPIAGRTPSTPRSLLSHSSNPGVKQRILQGWWLACLSRSSRYASRPWDRTGLTAVTGGPHRTPGNN